MVSDSGKKINVLKTNISTSKIKGLPLLKKTVQKYRILSKLINPNGNLDFSDFREIQETVLEINNSRNSGHYKSSELQALIIITNLLRKAIHGYILKIDPDFFRHFIKFITSHEEENTFSQLQKIYSKHFTAAEKTDQNILGLIFLNEFMIIWLNNQNQAAKTYKELFDDGVFGNHFFYKRAISSFRNFVISEPYYPESNLNLIDFLLQPFKKHPDSILKQLEFIVENWRELVGEDYLWLLKAIDLLKEETKIHFFGPGPAEKYQFDESVYDFEPERFTEDSSWMPRLVMIAKSVYVWLDQLEKKYQREIITLDQIPDEELQELSEYGFTGLWLIGIWERSKASRRIKEIMGNHDALASAYSLKRYSVAHELGGDSAMKNLQERAWKYGIRVGCDIVPNHAGLDSDWLSEHPDWFIQTPVPPYPAYSFHGENLSHNDNIYIQIEDHYYNKTDAAVVFRFHDKRESAPRYIYHGNDGTSFPWNDTAQLNYLLPEVREAVIRMIIDIAKQYPIIRFDAAMTLAKKHFQRLWFPEPGTGGDIPSRANWSMTKAAFNKLMPEEFWREVVDRAAVEAPDTLLLAEAFWMMEGYFVRSLGMHRVYNSAFMNMLKDEENAKYRESIFNILEFNPQILKRFVNFMSNPDEETAVIQFGKDDKYFGVAIVMVTMPGLPMFAHGQIEGYVEKYGMEYAKSKWHEQPDEYFIERHKKEIFPILRKRKLFAEVDNFLLYDFITDFGYINENVFAYSNRYQNESALVLFHNKYDSVRGRILEATVFGNNSSWSKIRIAEALQLSKDDNYYFIFRDVITNLQYIRGCTDIWSNGIHFELRAYEYKVFWDMHQVADDESHRFEKLNHHLNGSGSVDIYLEMKKMALYPVIDSFRRLIEVDFIKDLNDYRIDKNISINEFLTETQLENSIKDFYRNISIYNETDSPSDELFSQIMDDFFIWFSLPEETDNLHDNVKLITKIVSKSELFVVLSYHWIVLRSIGAMALSEDSGWISKGWIESLLLEDSIMETLYRIEPGTNHSRWLNLLKIAVQNQNLWQSLNTESIYYLLKEIFDDEDCAIFLDVNEFNNVLWFNKEAFEDLIHLLYLTNWISAQSYSLHYEIEVDEHNEQLHEFFDEMTDLMHKSDFQVNRLLRIARGLPAEEEAPENKEENSSDSKDTKDSSKNNI
ncbi:MAG: alpha-amylase family glycosyl hydrolase [Candidatus Cloacimonetes bacterium]|nr:alpha-amylase family glycosyl hydrolase [Candidatus Cloacimonadota bacterium]